jgi:hypothetical protein
VMVDLRSSNSKDDGLGRTSAQLRRHAPTPLLQRTDFANNGACFPILRPQGAAWCGGKLPEPLDAREGGGLTVTVASSGFAPPLLAPSGSSSRPAPERSPMDDFFRARQVGCLEAEPHGCAFAGPCSYQDSQALGAHGC